MKQELTATTVYNVSNPKSIIISPNIETYSDDPQETFHTEQEDFEALIFSNQLNPPQLADISKPMIQVSHEGLELQPSSSPRSDSPKEAAQPESNPIIRKAGRASTQAYSEVASLRTFKYLQIKVYKIEKQLQSMLEDRKGFEKKWPELKSLHKLKQDDPDQREDLTHELHLRFITLIEETNHLKALFSNIKPRDAYSDLLRPERVPNFGQYIPFSVRIKKLEDLSEEFVTTYQIENLRSSIEELKFKLAGLSRVSIDKEYKEEASTQNLYIESGAISTYNSSSANEISDIIKPKANASPEEKFNELYSNINKLFWYLSQKTTRKDVEGLMRTYKPAAKEVQSSEGLEWLIEKYKEHESRLITDWNDIKELKKSFKAIDHDLREYLAKESKEIRTILKENYVSNKIEIENKYQLIETKLFNPESEDSLQNLQSVRLHVIKLQKDMTTMTGKLAELEEKLYRSQNPIPFDSGDEAENSRSDFSLSKISTILKKHETQFNILKNQIAKLHFDMQVSDQKVLKHTEVIHQSNIKELEEMKASLSDIINKMREGNKLNHKDVNKLNELYEIIEHKGDKDEILQKVDKNELKKAYRFLSKKIETLQKDLKKAADTQLAQQNREEPYILRKSVGTECLACGQTLSKARAKSEAKIWNKMPVHSMKVNNKQFGPGFSKLLPLINQQSQESQARNKSDLGMASRSEIVFDESGDTSLRRRERVLINTDRAVRSNTRN